MSIEVSSTALTRQLGVPIVEVHGPLRVRWADGRVQLLASVRATGQRCRLLAMLAVESAGMDRAAACAWLWPLASPEGARASLRQQLFQLKQLPLLQALPLVATPQRLNWRVQTDLALFDDLGAASAAAPATLADQLDATSAPLLQGLEDGSNFDDWLLPWRERARRRWRQRLLQALADPEALPVERARRLIERALDLEPFDEPVIKLHLRWLARHEGAVAARLAYDAWSDRLRAELGHRARFDLTPLLSNDMQAPRAELSASASAPGGRFFGREDELARIDGWLGLPLASVGSSDGARLLCVWGPPGSGKTRLALRWAQRACQAGVDVAVVELNRLDQHRTEEGLAGTSPSERGLALLHLIAQACGLALDGAGDVLAQLAQHLQSVPGRVVLLGNFDHRLADRPLLQHLLAHTPVRWLVTSCHRLGLAGEQLLPLGGLQLQAVAGDGQTPPAAQQLLCDRADLVLPLDPAARRLVDVLCQQAEGQPLALELAGRLARRLGLPAALAALRDNLGALVSDEPDRPLRQRSLDAAFASVLATLTPRLRDAMPRLALLRCEFDSELAAALVAPLSVLDGMVAASLLALDVSSGRYRWHPFLREFALRSWQHDRSGAQSCRLLLTVHVAEVLRRMPENDPTAGDDRRRWVCQHWPVVQDAWRTARSCGRHALWQALAEAISAHCEAVATYREGYLLLSEPAVVAEAQRVHEPAAARAQARVDLLRAHLAHWFDGETSLHCLALAEPALARYRDREAIREGLRLQGLAHWRSGRSTQAVAWQRKALRMCRGPQHQVARAQLLDGLGLSLLSIGRWADAVRAFEQALALNEQAGQTHQAVQNLVNLALDPRPERRHAAIHLAQRALTLAREVGYENHVPHALAALAWAHLHQGAPGRARQVGLAAAEHAQALGDSFAQSWALGATARAALQLSDLAAAAVDGLRAFEAARRLHETPPLLMHLSFTAAWALANADPLAALRLTLLCQQRPELNARLCAELQHTERLAREACQAGELAEALDDDLGLAWPTAVHEAMGLLAQARP
jgi:DNA-binding SARP family transcriptional activator/tetratricopeptide (TPR) repeat protein